MKLTKQLLSVLLAMALAFGLLLPAAHAEESDAAAQDAPVITIVTQPKAFTKTLTNKEVTLSVEAKIPEGVNGTLRYQWYQMDDDGVAVEMEGESSPELRLRLTFDDLRKRKWLESVDEMMTSGTNSLYYYVMATCDYTEDGQEKSVSATSTKAEVYVYPSLVDFFRLLWSIGTYFIRIQPEGAKDNFLRCGMAIMTPMMISFVCILLPMVLPFEYIRFWLI